jgi:hypothetical protein
LERDYFLDFALEALHLGWVGLALQKSTFLGFLDFLSTFFIFLSSASAFFFYLGCLRFRAVSRVARGIFFAQAISSLSLRAAAIAASFFFLAAARAANLLALAAAAFFSAEFFLAIAY